MMVWHPSLSVVNVKPATPRPQGVKRLEQSLFEASMTIPTPLPAAPSGTSASMSDAYNGARTLSASLRVLALVLTAEPRFRPDRGARPAIS